MEITIKKYQFDFEKCIINIFENKIKAKNINEAKKMFYDSDCVQFISKDKELSIFSKK